METHPKHPAKTAHTKTTHKKSATHATPHHASEPEPAILASLPPAALKAVHECHAVLGVHPYTPQPESPPALPHPPRHLSKAQAKFMQQLNSIENKTHEALYIQKRYDEQIAAATRYTDAFVDGWQQALPSQGKSIEEKKNALKEKFHAIIAGTAGMETGWSVEEVRGSAGNVHSGVFQTEWAYMNDARGVFEQHPSMMNELRKHSDDLATLQLSGHSKAVRHLPTTSFAGQGAAFAGMLAQSYESFIAKGGSPDAFNGVVAYEDHLLGATGADKFRKTLADKPEQGHPGISKPAYNGNYLITSSPRVPLNDLNPERIVFSDATPADVMQMLHDKFVSAHHRLTANGASDEQLKSFKLAFLPDWQDPQKQQADIERIQHQRELGRSLRGSDEAKADSCVVLMPLSAYLPKEKDGPVR